MIEQLTNAELIDHLTIQGGLTPVEVELLNRLMHAIDEVEALERTLEAIQSDVDDDQDANSAT